MTEVEKIKAGKFRWPNRIVKKCFSSENIIYKRIGLWVQYILSPLKIIKND